MRSAALGAACGALALQWSAALPGLGRSLAILAVAACLAGLAARWQRPWRFGVIAASVAGIAFVWAAALAHLRLEHRLPADLEGRDLVVEGVVAGLPQPFDRGVRFVLDVDPAADSGARGRLALAWYTGPGPGEFQVVLPIRAGERWRFTVRLKRPHTNANPHGFDYEAWLLEQDIRATGYVRPHGERVRVAPLAARPGAWIDRLRDQIRERFRAALPEGRYAGILIALAVGDQRSIRNEDWAVFNRTGVGHLMSISGLHVTMIAGLMGVIASALWRRSARLPIHLPARKFGALAALAAAFGYCLLAGFGIPAQRTLYMITVAVVALWLDRAQSGSRVLAAALLAVVVLDPWAVLAPGFWLSFAAVGILFYTVQRLQNAHWLGAWTRAQLAITLGLAPLSVALFQQVSVVSPVANALAIPLVSFVITPLALLAALVPIEGLAHLAHLAVVPLMPLLAWLAELPIAVWQQAAPPLWALALAIAGVLWLLAPAGIPARFVALPLFAPLLMGTPERPQHGAAWIDVLDVGQGLAVVVRTARHALVYDTGPAYGLEADAGNRVVVPFLRGEGIGRLDRLIVTHQDNDHSGGAASLAHALPVGIVQTSMPLQHPAFARGAYRLPCTAGQRWTWDGVEFSILHPAVADYDRRAKTNALSCVLNVRAAGRSMLLTGDIEAREERALVNALAGALRADVLLAPHHGSRTSSSQPFLDAVDPSHIVVPVGYRNRFGHPHPTVMARYAATRASLTRSDRAGAIRVGLAPDGVEIHSFRAQQPRYWR